MVSSIPFLSKRGKMHEGYLLRFPLYLNEVEYGYDYWKSDLFDMVMRQLKM
jgi:hypothetical protein